MIKICSFAGKTIYTIVSPLTLPTEIILLFPLKLSRNALFSSCPGEETEVQGG